MLKAENLSKSFKKKVVVRNVSLQIERGEIVGLLGPNGAGKTTCFYIITGFLRPDQGKILLEEESITHLDVAERAKKGIVYLPQESSVFRKLTVAENFKIVLERLKDNFKKLKEKLEYYIELFNLKDVLNQKTYTLSGGQKRKVEIVRALLIEPRFILLDEPFAGIDPIGIAQLKEILKNLKKEKIGILISDHNVRDTLKICDKGYVIAEGEIIGKGTPEEILENDLVKEKFLGEKFFM
ncbi:MAG: LPS export ABC transporter ATP-binding protein [Thermodesulfobacterium geofontis]|uniref:LPS export ABC transporter ATP-binding protein n=1 Tax=Thermodesulfobacterium geofontis TaxID=1295609 RepID=A0A2N7PP90_9BACT|nr:MAG: LPS export ABC transporter ATP-binding protein [Thermodesulfobacterium geofontis]PMP93850.1 MAG: LPS export ABC transporter ATP-binding protein [Thermodesulfobacterium geofontis]HEM55398.1 LPS export ABC transporter ATP-binding protein [Thermodesulfobium narugense]